MARQQINAGDVTPFASIVSKLVPSPFERPLWVLLWLGFISSLAMLGVDFQVAIWMKEFPEHLLPVVNLVTRLGEGTPVLIGSGLLIVFRTIGPLAGYTSGGITRLQRYGGAAVFVFCSVAASGVTALVLKYAIGRGRPSVIDSPDHLTFMPFAMHSDFAAFPSGHSATAAGMAVCLALVFPGYRVIFIFTGLAICLSRQIVGAHWMSDTIAGWAVGAATTYCIAHLFARLNVLFSYDDLGRLSVRRSAISLGGMPSRSPDAVTALGL